MAKPTLRSNARSGDFFACGLGEDCQINSLAVCVNPGSAFNCYWPMPFHKQARITMENIGDQDMVLYYQIDYTLAAGARETPAISTRSSAVKIRSQTKGLYTILDGVQGEGQYVDTYLAFRVHNSDWWGEGEIKFYLDGDTKFPTICGTGTEDYFCGSYNFENRRDPQIPDLFHSLHRSGPGDSAGRSIPAGPVLRPLSLACYRSDPLPGKTSRL